MVNGNAVPEKVTSRAVVVSRVSPTTRPRADDRPPFLADLPHEEGHPEPCPFRMICHTADHHGELIPSREITEEAWFRYSDRGRVSVVDEIVFAVLHEAGGFPDREVIAWSLC
ncbi:DNA mismatch repair protein MutT [Streptomyces sp. NPDC047081]|uniref:DNA mismatch repair protein MutT n=1 Tax=Streptomyces sp. NPDC047081 TaxID=3154706 RepID=UPI0033F41DFB